ncbi:metallophosphoesterase family protein [Bdellovibrio sp. HCB2-146]|uniref:metallophosphoesterase family protein n=1 Tax=Bdellovibrio sp. HCB2-146 TaxID=3394362 RepID=UPI0039BC2F68
MKTIFVSLFFLLTITSCAPFVDSPFSDALLRPERNLNGQSIDRLGDIDADGVIRIAVFSDSHQNYKALDKVTFAMNQVEGIDFIAGLGDFTNSAYNLEYDQFIDALEYLKYPKMMAIGNHDAIGAGPELFRKAFGNPNFYFESTSHRYIFFDSNNLENPDDFDLPWLKKTVDDSALPVFIFSHVQLRDPERYFGDDAAMLDTIIKDSKVQLILNGHNHVYDLLDDNTTVMLQCARVEGEQWLLLEITGFNLCIKRMDTQETVCKTLKTYP